MNFLVIGHSVVDKIKDKKGLSIKPGGIFYTAISLSSFLQPGEKLYLCTNVDKSSYKLFSFIYDKFPQTFIHITENIPSVQLKINESGEREEKYEKLTGNLNTEFTNEINFECILVNMITGFDISPEQIEKLRHSSKGIIYFDVHTLSRGMDSELKRDFRKIPDFKRWAACIDILQANEAELKAVTDSENEEEIIEQLLGYGIKQVIVTKAEKGASIYFIEEGEIKLLNQDALRTKNINSVGCGDVFGAVYFYNYVKNKNIKEALFLANTAAGISTGYDSIDNFLNLNEDVRKQLDKA